MLPRWLVALAWVAVVTALSFVPQDVVPDSPVLGFDKLVHFVIYAALAFLLLRALARPSQRGIVVVAVSCAAFGGLLEIAQGLLPVGRCGSVADAVANALGAVAVCVYWDRVVNARGPRGAGG